MTKHATTTRTEQGPIEAGHAVAEGGGGIEIRILATGSDLKRTVGRLVDAIPDAPSGPQALAKRMSIDKVLASRVLRAIRSADEMSALHRFPGPAPLRRVLRGAARLGVDPTLVAEAEDAVDRFDDLLRNDLGDRGTLDAIVAAWVPEARRDFENRNKQAAYKAMSQLKGVRAQSIMATAILAPAEDPGRLDLVWLSGLIGLQRLRPRAAVTLATRRVGRDDDGRRPATLDGRAIEGFHDAVLEPFTSSPAPRVDVHKSGEVIQYTLDPGGLGPESSHDLVLAEVNRAELPRYAEPGANAKRFLFAEVSQPTKTIQFDVIVHRDVFPGREPELRIYDTVLEGVADVNDPARDLDRMDMHESIESLGTGLRRVGSTVVPRYGPLMAHVLGRLAWDGDAFRGYRCTIDHPVYGCQIAMCFDPTERV